MIDSTLDQGWGQHDETAVRNSCRVAGWLYDVVIANRTPSASDTIRSFPLPVIHAFHGVVGSWCTSAGRDRDCLLRTFVPRFGELFPKQRSCGKAEVVSICYCKVIRYAYQTPLNFHPQAQHNRAWGDVLCSMIRTPPPCVGNEAALPSRVQFNWEETSKMRIM